MPSETPGGALQPRDPFYRVLAVLCGLAILRLWILPTANSFGIDETLIVWTIRDGFRSIVPNAFVSLQSIAFCMVEWLASRLGMSEIALRLPSLLGAGAAIYTFYRIGRRAGGHELGVLIAAVFASHPSVAVEAANARPYALALLFHAGALYWLLGWLGSGRPADGLLWAGSAAGAAHFHHLFAVALPIEALFALWPVLRRRTPVRLLQLLGCGAAAAILLLPAIPQARILLSQGGLLSYAARPSAQSLAAGIVPLALLPSVALAALLERRAGRRPRWIAPRDARGMAALGAMICFVPTLGFFAASYFTSLRLFEAKYLLPSVAGAALFWGWALRGLEPAPFRRHAAIVLVALNSFVFMAGGPALVRDFPGDNWRAAVRSLPESGPLLFYPGLVETRRLDWLEDPERWSYLTAPISAYGQGISRDRVFVLPFGTGEDELAYGKRLTERVLPQEPISVLVREAFSGPEWATRIAAQLASHGYELQHRARFGSIELRVFRRAGPR